MDLPLDSNPNKETIPGIFLKNIHVVIVKEFPADVTFLIAVPFPWDIRMSYASV